jgi:hypothetical protein
MSEPTPTHFWDEERRRLAVRNASAALAFQDRRDELTERRTAREAIVVTCMDERNTHILEALDLIPGEPWLYCSGGGKIGIDTFEKLFGKRIDWAAGIGREVSVYLVPHECNANGHLGCAAFANDTAAQKDFFTALKKEILHRHPKALVHVLAFDTSSGRLREVDADARDRGMAGCLRSNADRAKDLADEAHAGHGIYAGDAYRAWVNERNAYFSLAADNPNLAADIGIALKVMGHHSEVDLAETPAILHIDYPLWTSAERTRNAAANIDAAITALESNETFRDWRSTGKLTVFISKTDMDTWSGKLHEVHEQAAAQG